MSAIDQIVKGDKKENVYTFPHPRQLLLRQNLRVTLF